MSTIRPTKTTRVLTLIGQVEPFLDYLIPIPQQVPGKHSHILCSSSIFFLTSHWHDVYKRIKTEKGKQMKLAGAQTFLTYSLHIPSPACLQPLQLWPFMGNTALASLSWALLALFLFSNSASHWMHHPVYVQTPVGPALKMGLNTTILCAPGSGSPLWFMSNPTFSPALLHSEVLPLKHFAINGRVQSHTSSCCPRRTAMSSSGC